MTDKLKREMTEAVDRLNECGVPPTIQLHAPDEAVVGAKLFAAYQLTRIDAMEVGPPLSMLKRVIRRFVRPVLSRQSAYNQAIADTVSELNHQFVLSRRELGVVDDMVEHQRRSTAVHLATLKPRSTTSDTGASRRCRHRSPSSSRGSTSSVISAASWRWRSGSSQISFRSFSARSSHSPKTCAVRARRPTSAARSDRR